MKVKWFIFLIKVTKDKRRIVSYNLKLKKMKPIIRKIITPTNLSSWMADIAILVPRVICGLLLAFMFGSDKFGMPWSPEDHNLRLFEVVYWFPQDVAEYGGVFKIFSGFFAWMGAFSEAVGGLLLAAGFMTRVAAFLICCTMLVAIFMQKWGQGLWGMLPAMGFLWVSIYAMVLGSGRIGFDHFLKNVFNEK